MRWIRHTQRVNRLLVCTLSILLVARAFAQNSEPPKTGVMRVPYPPPNDQQIELELTFSEGDRIPDSGGKMLWKHARLKQFPKTGGEPELIAETPECTSDNRLDEISSPESLKVEAANGHILLDGVGFLLLHGNSTLVVSNQVHCTLVPSAASNTPAPAPTVIFSHRGEFEMKPDATNGIALYIGDVRVLDPKMTLVCDWLKAEIPKSGSGATNHFNHITALTNVVIDLTTSNGETIRATGQRATYDNQVANGATNEVIELTGNPRVELTNGWMTAEVFTFDRSSGKLHGRDNYHFHYLPQNAGGSASTNPPVETEITSDGFDFDLNTRVAIFSSHVNVDDPRINLGCERLTAPLPKQEPGRPGQLDHILAETNVAIDIRSETNSEPTHATGQKATYDFKVSNGTTNEILTLTGNPAVETPRAWMTADVITVDRAQGRIWGEGNHHSVLKGTVAMPGTTMLQNSSATTDTEIFSDRFDFTRATGLALYHDHVRAYNPGLNLLNAKLLTVKIVEETHGQTRSNRVEKIEAQGDVALDFIEKPFASGDITNLPALAGRLKSPAASDPVGQYVASQLGASTKKLLAVYQDGANAPLQQWLTDDLNRIVENGRVYDPARFTNIYLSLDTTSLMKSNPLGLDVVELNRLLLFDAFRGELTRGRSGEKLHATADRAIYTNRSTRSGAQAATANAFLELIGHPKVTRPDGWVAAQEAITYDSTIAKYEFIGRPHFHYELPAPVKTASAPKKKAN